jgi:ATP-binding cassette subfamily F protein 3
VSRARARGSEAPTRPGRERLSQAAAPAPAVSARPAPAAASANRRDERKQQAQTRAQLANRTRPLRLEVQQIDTRLEKLGTEKTELEGGLAAGSLSGHDIAECGRRLNHIAAETAMLEERWLELHGEIESLTSGNS